MKTIDNLKKRATGIRLASLEAEITPERLGSLLADMIELLGTVTLPGEGKTVKISIAYHLADGSWGSTYPEGTVEVPVGGSLKVRMLPVAGHEVERFNVDQVEQPLATEYTFTDVQTDHTMYVWFKQGVAPEEVYSDFLERSDKPGTYYSSTHVALNAIKADYPGKLTRDVTLSCVKTARDRRDVNDENKLTSERIFLSVLKQWNQGSMFTLTIDGANSLTCDCVSLGGLRFDRVDNVIIKNTTFVNFSNFIEGGTPEEVAAIMALGSDRAPARNLYIHNCTFNGISIANKVTCSMYTMNCKYIENLTVFGSTFANNAGLTFRMSDATLVSFVKNTISGVMKVGSVAHPGIFSLTNGKQVFIEDCDINGTTFRESLMYFSGMDSVCIRRNHIHGGARIAEVTANNGVKELTVDSNLIVNVLMNPYFPWIHECFSTDTPVNVFNFRNNTLYMGGNDYMQFVTRFTQQDTREANIYNNIIVDPSSGTSSPVGGFIFKSLGTLRSKSNIFKFSVKNMDSLQANSLFYEVTNPDSSPDSLTIKGTNRYNLRDLQNNGHDTGSTLVAKTVKLLDMENGGSSYAITPENNALYPCDDSLVPVFDRDYKARVETGNSRGCYNLSGTLVDEPGDVTVGYAGLNLTEPGGFNSSARYDTVADCVLLLSHNTLDRGRVVRFSATGSQHETLGIGKHVVFHACPELNDNGEYLSDELYTITID